jgi:hypothetical protein
MKQGFLVILLLVLATGVSYAQSDEGLPLPGAITTHPTRVENVIDMAPAPGKTLIIDRAGSATPVNAGQSSPLPGASLSYQGNASAKSSYQLLPISAAEAKTRLEELRTLLLISKPQAIQDRIYNLCDWLTEMYEAHNKLANAFARQDETKGIALTEKSTAQTFSRLKNEAQLLKAELLIKQNRAPEALTPLINIVVADANSATARVAYQHLKELGFSENVPEQIITQVAKESSQPRELARQTQASAPKAGQPNKQDYKQAKSAIVKMPGKQIAGQARRSQPSTRIVKVNR